MPDNRFYSDSPLLEDSTVVLQGTEFHHLVNVMRAREGDAVEIVNGRGDLATAKISNLAKKSAALLVHSVNHSPESNVKLILAQAVPRMNRLDFIIEKGTELGMTELLLFPGETSERKKLTEDQVGRMQSVVISAMKQCGRLYLPRIELRPLLSKWSKIEGNAFFGDILPEAPPFAEVLRNQARTNDLIFFVGPESGFTDAEIAILVGLGARGVKLHENILRTDTASLAALAIASQYISKDYSKYF